MKIIEKSVEELTPYENNPRKNDGAVDAVAASIREFGFKVPIIIDKDNVIVAGHTRLKAARKLGLETVPCIIADDLSPEQIQAFRLADNKTAELADWDFDILSVELSKLTDIDMSMFSFNLDDFVPNQHEWFENHEKNDQSRQEGNDEYNEFLDKFEQKKTTDDCYTPQIVYDAIADWVAKAYGLEKQNFIRPFYPGGDYQNEKYPAGGGRGRQSSVFDFV